MADTDNNSEIPKLTPEQRQKLIQTFNRAKQVAATGNFDYTIDLLKDCCKASPADIPIRQELRKWEKKKYNDNKKGKPLSFLSTLGTLFKLIAANRKQRYLKAIELAEDIFTQNPWHIKASLQQSKAFNELGLKDLALWTLDQARPVAPEYHVLNRAMAKLFEERGNFTQAIALWKLVAKKCPKDQEAAKKATHLAASETIMKGGYDEAASGGARTPIKKDRSDTHRAVADNGEDAGASLAQERIAKDENLYLKRISENPSNPSAYLQLGQLYRRNDMADKAREMLTKGLQVAPKNFDLTMELADLDIDPFRKDLSALEQKLLEDAKNADLFRLKAEKEKEINSRELAFYRTKSDRFPTDTVARFEMAVRLFKTGTFDEAINEFQKVRSDPKHSVRARIYLGLAFVSRNNWRLAQKNLEEALQNLTAAEESFRKELMYQLSVGYSKNGELPRAIELGCELANHDYNYRDISALIDKWQSKPPPPPPPAKDARKR
jgi:tetratricopeptide (TPR) repeat protein